MYWIPHQSELPNILCLGSLKRALNIDKECQYLRVGEDFKFGLMGLAFELLSFLHGAFAFWKMPHKDPGFSGTVNNGNCRDGDEARIAFHHCIKYIKHKFETVSKHSWTKLSLGCSKYFNSK